MVAVLMMMAALNHDLLIVSKSEGYPISRTSRYLGGIESKRSNWLREDVALMSDRLNRMVGSGRC